MSETDEAERGQKLDPADGTERWRFDAETDPQQRPANNYVCRGVTHWQDADGKTQEKVYDVVWGDAESRKPGSDGKLPAVGNTVDVKNATWSNSIGDPELLAFWTDPDFNPDERAFYYARVIEIPTPRWTAYDAKRFGVEAPEGTVMEHQIDVKMLLFNNGYLGMVRQWQTLFFDGRYSGTPMQNPDYSHIAQAYGIPYLKVEKVKDIAPALKKAVAQKGPILVEFDCDPSEVILPMIPSGGGFDDMIVTRPGKEKSASKKKRKASKS